MSFLLKYWAGLQKEFDQACLKMGAECLMDAALQLMPGDPGTIEDAAVLMVVPVFEPDA